MSRKNVCWIIFLSFLPFLSLDGNYLHRNITCVWKSWIYSWYAGRVFFGILKHTYIIHATITAKNIVGIFKSVFKVPPLPLYSVANPRHRLTQPLRIVSTFSMVWLFFWVNPMEIFSMADHFWKKILLSTVDRG